jgi:hypothetical protein
MSDERYFEYGVPGLTDEEYAELERRLHAAIDAYLKEIGKPIPPWKPTPGKKH